MPRNQTGVVINLVTYVYKPNEKVSVTQYACPYTCNLLNNIKNEHMIRVRVRVAAQVPVHVQAHLLNLSNMCQMRTSGTEPSSVILSQTK